MFKEQKKENDKRPQTRIESYYATAEWFIVAISVTLVFIVFQMQAYTIPTGSMADTLKGAHFRLRCSQCAYQFDHNFHPAPYGVRENKTPGKNVPVGLTSISANQVAIIAPRCPSCGFYQDIARPGQYQQQGQTSPMPVMKGDRIFVLKNIYQFRDPKRWDVTVFKNPVQPNINYIKRMIGLPGEEVEIIDGDIYIDGSIARKPANVQKELWMVIYDNDYHPARPDTKRFNGHTWSQPFENGIDSNWNLNADGPTVFSLSSEQDDIQYIVYNPEKGNNFQATYAYDNPKTYPYMPICSDLMVRFYVSQQGEGTIGADLSKYGVRYRGYIENSSEMVLAAFDREGNIRELARKKNNSQNKNEAVLFKFANVDHKLSLEYGREKLEFDLGGKAESLGQRKTELSPRVAVIGSGDLELKHIAVFRDIHYISNTPGEGDLRAAEGKPFKLGKDEFFVLGDNSPASADSRYWRSKGLGNGDKEYRMGTVPRDYLVGKAFFVYWPGPYKPSDKFIRIIPDIGGMKTIKGGKKQVHSDASGPI